MRLICPNCSAQYEIDVTLIPDEGRDVQCSNCGHTWFELPPALTVAEGAAPEVEEAPDEEQTDELPSETEDTPDTPSHAALAIAAASEDDDSDDEIYEASPDTSLPDDDEEDWDIPARPASTPATPRRPVDAASVDILKEEAAREMSQRRATPTSRIETQSDLGLEDIRRRQTPSRALRARMAHLKEDEAESRPAPEGQDLGPPSQAELVSNTDYQAPRRDLLPDIDEINSTLKSTKKREGSSEATQKSGFRAGFLLMTLAAIFLIVIYAQAPAIARALPGSEGALISYVDGANSLRDWVDGLMGK